MLDGNAGSGCLLGRVGWGFAGLETLVSPNLKSDFWSLRIVWGDGLAMGDLPRCMGRCSRRVAVWGGRKTYGEMTCVLEAAESHGGAAETYGKRHKAWETAPVYGGGRQAVWGPKTALKPGIWERRRPAGSADFNEFLAETAVLSGRPLKCMGISRTWQCMSCQMRPAGSADFWQYRRRRLGMGNPPSRLSYLSLLGELCLACRAGGDLVGRPDLLRYAV